MNTFPIVPEIKVEDLVLKPFSGGNDFDYLIDLAQEYAFNRRSREEMETEIGKHGYMFWRGFVGDVSVVVVFIRYFSEHKVFTVDGFRDDEGAWQLRDANGITKSYPTLALNAVSDWFLNGQVDKLYTQHDTRNRAATILCKRCGFRETHRDEEHVTLVKEKGASHGT